MALHENVNHKIFWHVCYKPELGSQQGQPLLGNSSANIPVARQWLSENHATTAMLMYVMIEKLLEVVFSV
jgi:hypothetical protein